MSNDQHNEAMEQLRAVLSHVPAPCVSGLASALEQAVKTSEPVALCNTLSAVLRNADRVAKLVDEYHLSESEIIRKLQLASEINFQKADEAEARTRTLKGSHQRVVLSIIKQYGSALDAM